MRFRSLFFIFALAPLVTFAAEPSRASVRLPGLQADGSILLHNQWSIRPAGRQIQLDGTLPVNIAVHPRGKFAAIMDCGYGLHEVEIVNLTNGLITACAAISNSFYGITFSANGKKLYCSGGGDETVRCFDFRDGKIINDTTIRVHDKVLRAVPTGLAINHRGTKLFAANVWGNCVSEIMTKHPTNVIDFPVGKRPVHLTMAPVVPPEDFETAAADKRAEVGFYSSDPDDAYPYAVRLDEKHKRLYVSLWGQASVKVIDLKRNKMTNWPAQDHPCEMTLTRSGKILYVANANRNTVTVLETANGRVLETISAAFSPGDPPGATPNSLALSPDQKTLYVANANVNAVAVFDVRKPGHSRSLGFIPVGWYPTSVRVTPDGRHLLVANGKGGTPKANPRAPGPGGKKNSEYIASLFRGTLSIIDLPDATNSERQMGAWTGEVYNCAPPRPGSTPAVTPSPDNPIPTALGQHSPIRYVIYIVKENRTYDQVFGDMPQGNGDPDLCLFPDALSPNHHELAREFVLLDNFYADACISADGHEWSMGAYASDFVEKMWPMNYGHNKNGKFPYPAEGYFPIAAPAGGYLWDRAAEMGVSYRDYGEFVSYDQPPDTPCRARVKALEGHIDPLYRGFDLKYSDARRVERYLSEFKRLEAANEMPHLQIVRLPSDHTHGTTANFPTPAAYVADNDLALGKIVDTVSHSKYWPETAIFVVEDDAQNGPDHVDAHRTVALVISPYTRHGATDSTFYSTSSMLRTMELILGLRPMTQFDAAATPMFDSFQAQPVMRPYTALPETVNMKEKNLKTAWGSGLKMDFSREDAADEQLLNEAVWKSVRGAASPMPAPVHAAFVFTRGGDDDD